MTLLNNRITYITLSILHQLLVEVKSQAITARNAHTATLIENKLYILSGTIPPNNNISPKETFLYLDFSVPFSTNELTWINLSNINIVPPHQDAAVISGGANNRTLFLYGGRSLLSAKVMYLVYTFNTQSNLWEIQETTVGGYNANFGVFPLNEVYLYDTISDIWTIKVTSGTIPSPRSSFSTVLGLDGQRVILFGGFGNDNTNLFPENSLYVLDLNNFIWHIPNVSGEKPSNRAFHKTAVIGKYMVITFGSGYTQGIENDILLLDISNNYEYVWTTSFVPPAPNPVNTASPAPTTISASHNNRNTIILGGVIFGVLLIAIGSLLFFRWYRSSRKEQNFVAPTSEGFQGNF